MFGVFRLRAKPQCARFAGASLVQITGDLQAGDLESNLLSALSEAGFLEDEIFERRRAEAEREFAEAPLRRPAHAGTGYPGEAGELRSTFAEYLNGAKTRWSCGK